MRWALPCIGGIAAAALFCALMALPAFPASPSAASAELPSLALAASPAGDPGSSAFEDVLGNRLAWSRPPARIVSLSPNLTEMLFAIDCSARVVGVTRFCDVPAEADALPEVGGIVDPSLEAIVALAPDLVLATRGNSLEFLASLKDLGIPVYAVDTSGDLNNIPRVIRELGAVTGHPAQADSLAGYLESRRAKVIARFAGLASAQRPRVYYGELEGALWTAGPGSFLHNLIEDAGGRNVAGHAPAPWCALSMEAVAAEDPQVYLGPCRSGADEERVRRILSTHPVWRAASLGRDPRLFLVDENRLLRPGPRTFDVLEEFAAFLHPDSAATAHPESAASASRETSAHPESAVGAQTPPEESPCLKR